MESPKFNFELQRGDLQEMDSVKNKTLEEIVEDFDMNKPPINCTNNDNANFLGWDSEEAMLGCEEIMERDFMKFNGQINWGIKFDF